jgi:O-antigen/teichoic acid export membrane protein
VFYGESVLHLWTGSADVAAAAASILKLLVMGSVFAGLSNLPYSLQLAYGNPRLSLTLTALGLCVYAPALWIAANAFGALGAAWAWMGLHLTLLLTGVHLMHRTMLAGEEATWYLRDVIPVFAAAFAVGFALHIAWAEFPRTLAGFAMISIATALLAVAALLAARDVRVEARLTALRLVEGASAFRRQRPPRT